MIWTVNRIIALVIGIVFLLIGIVGFMTPAENGTGVQAALGIFDVDTFHNIVYVVIGVLGIIASFTTFARAFNQIAAVFFLLFGILGLIPALYSPTYGNDNGLFLGLTHNNAADHVLHIVAGLAAAYAGFLAHRTVTTPATTTNTTSDPMI